MTYQLTTLTNGLRVASERLPGLETVAVSLSVGVGSRHETATEHGLSHLLEHMAFKGTATRSARDIAEAFDNIGGQFNAYTSTEMTVYYAKVLKEDVSLAVDILTDILQHSTFAEDELTREKEVILQEIAMHRDMPEDLIVDHFDSVAFKNQPLGRSILGSEELVSNYTRDQVMGYMRKHYTPQRMVLTATGNIDHEKFVSLTERYFHLDADTRKENCEVANYVGGDARVTGDFEQLHLLMGLPTVNMHSPDYYTLQLYTSILGGGMSSRLFQEVREKRGLAYSVYASASAYSDVGILGVYAAASPEKAAELSGVLCDEIKRMATSITQAELTRAKNQHRAELMMMRENPQAVASWIGRHLIMFGAYRPLADITARIAAVTADDITRLGAQMVRGTLTLAALGDVSLILPYEDLQKRLAG